MRMAQMLRGANAILQLAESFSSAKENPAHLKQYHRSPTGPQIYRDCVLFCANSIIPRGALNKNTCK